MVPVLLRPKSSLRSEGGPAAACHDARELRPWDLQSWVAVKELKVSYHNTLRFTMYTIPIHSK